MEVGRTPYKWPLETNYAFRELDVLDRACLACGRMMYICDHRYRRIHTLEGPVQLVCKLNHCPDPDCPGHAQTKSPEQEAMIAPPSWAIGWDVFCWIGHRRCSRHMSIPLIQSELLDDYAIKLSDDAIAKYIRRYQVMLAARQQDPEALRRQYESVDEIVLSIDGLQPEKGHETLLTLPDCRYRRNAGYPAGGIFVILLLSREGDARMDARPKTRQVDRERKTPSTQVPRGAKQIVIPMTQQQYDDIWHDADRVRSFIEQCPRSAPELFPAGFDQGYCLHGFGRESLKLSGLKLRKIVLANGASYWLRPSFIFSYMTGIVDQLAYPLLLAVHGVPPWLLTIGFGHSDMYWYRVIERLGRNSLVGTTVHDSAQLPEHLVADEHHADWAGQKGYIPTTVGGGCILGVALMAAADDVHLQEAYGVFAAEARDVDPEYAPQTVNTDGWASTRNAFQTLFPRITVVLCFLHGS